MLSTDFGSSSVDIARPRCEGRWASLFVGAGDLALRRGTQKFYVLDRATNGSLTALSAEGEVLWQSALDGCGAHDFGEVSAKWGLLTCYDDDALRWVSLTDGQVSAGPSLAEHADSDGLPEADQLLVTSGGHVLVSLQRLDRADGYRPSGPGRVLRGSLSFAATGDPELGSWIALDIAGLENPVTSFSEDGNFVSLGFAGDWQGDAGAAGRAFLDIEPFAVKSTVFSEPYRLWQASTSWWIGSRTVPGSLEISEMTLHFGAENNSTVTWQVDGFSVGGIAEDQGQNVYLTYRPADEPSAIVKFAPSGEQTLNLSWPLKPWEVVPVP